MGLIVVDFVVYFSSKDFAAFTHLVLFIQNFFYEVERMDISSLK